MKKTITIIIIIIIVIAAFFVGKAYGNKQATSAVSAQNANGTFSHSGMYGGSGRGAFGNATIGQVIAKDTTSITVSLPNGGSKIILYSPTTMVLKTDAGTLNDITVGSTITASGTANTDGSITATSIQIRPAGSTMPQGQTSFSTTPSQQ